MRQRNWALQDAKAHFSEVVKKAQKEGPLAGEGCNAKLKERFLQSIV